MADGRSLDPTGISHPVAADVGEETGNRLPPLPLPSVQIRWAGVLTVIGLMVVVVAVAQTIGPRAAAVATIAALLYLAWSATRGARAGARDGAGAHGGGGEALLLHGDASAGDSIDCGGFGVDFGVGGFWGDFGGGGGDC